MSASANELKSIGRNILAGCVAAVVLVGGVGVWAATTELSGAVIAAGTVVVESNVKKIQHLSGGVVARLFVREGSRVTEGDLLLRLDDTVLKANLAVVTKNLNVMLARKARLEAERDGRPTIEWPEDLVARRGDPDVAQAVAGEQRLFELRRDARNGQKIQLGERIAQLQEEIGGQLALQKAKREEIGLIEKELEGVKTLWDQNLVVLSRLTALSRESTRLSGELAQSISATAQSRGKITEIRQQIIQIDQELGSEVARDLREVDAKIGEFIERKVAAEDQLARVEIRAPLAGFIHQLAVHTVGGVVSPGEAIMLIVPEADRLSIEAKVSPQEIDQLYIGQPTGLRFTAFNQRTTPEISGTVTRISADTSQDQRNGQSYFTVRAAAPVDELQRLGSSRLVPGMPVEMFAKTYDRSVMSYFLKPLSDQIARAFRER